MKLYVKFNKPKTIREFLKIFYNRKLSSYYTNSKCLPELTYYDEECTKVQSRHERRSFDELYFLVKTYYSSITEKKLLHYLLTTEFLNINFNNQKTVPYIAACPTSKILKFIPYTRSTPYIQTSGKNIDDVKYKFSKHTCKTLLLLLNITTEQEYFDYINKYKET